MYLQDCLADNSKCIKINKYFTLKTNESGWTAVCGKVTGNILTIEAQEVSCLDTISWMVIGERKDPHMMDTDWTDDNGRVIVEPLKPIQPK